MLDKNEIKKLRDLPIEGVSELLGLHVARHKCLCPFHDDHHASLSFSARRNTFRCFVCGASGDTISLVMKVLRMDFTNACRWLAKEHHLPTSSHPATPPSTWRGDGGEAFCASRYARFFEHPWLGEEARRFLFEERRLDERVVRWCRLSSWKDKQGVAWLQIPYFNREGQLVGVQNRNLVKGALPRFRFPSASQISVYNLPVLNRLRRGEPLYISEGCSDCWSLLSAGVKAIAIASATLLSKKDVELLSALHATLSTEFHIFPDADVPGERLYLQLKEVLPHLVRHQLPPGCKDYSDYYVQTRIKEASNGETVGRP